MKNLINLLLILWTFSPLFSQTKLTKQQLDSLPNTLENQFIKTYSKAKRWHEYKMITKADFVGLQKNALDSVSKLKKNIASQSQVITEKEATIIGLETQIKTIDSDLNLAKEKENAINLLGFPLSKELYNTIVWSIIGLLTLGIAFFIYKYKNNISSTKNAKDSLAEIETEFEQYRKKTIEKEQKLRRQLHDEVNKNRGA